MSDLTIGQGTEVTMHFALLFEDGEVVDSNFETEPATFTVGDGRLLPGFESTLYGLKAGDEKEITIPPERGFGHRNDNNIQTMRRHQFEDSIELAEGLVVSFKDAAGAELPGVIMSFDDDEVTVDFNHPLSGKTIIFHVEIISVKPTVTH
ncbi:FKBP-type 16 kDa peptidyl-prolyl cis-trans isomerase [Thalassocella blandensis]|nr:FKBP-type 16 kDa peptidyl-prolyl cis-trans isomerase [Thalassocella blandensis]